MTDPSSGSPVVRRWALLDLLGSTLCLGVGGVLVWNGHPWATPAYQAVPAVVCVGGGAVGLAAGAVGGWWADRQRIRGLGGSGGLRVAGVGAVLAGLAALAAGAPWWVELWSEPETQPVLGSAVADIAVTAGYAVVPLVLGVGSLLAARRAA